MKAQIAMQPVQNWDDNVMSSSSKLSKISLRYKLLQVTLATRVKKQFAGPMILALPSAQTQGAAALANAPAGAISVTMENVLVQQPMAATPGCAPAVQLVVLTRRRHALLRIHVPLVMFPTLTLPRPLS